jgi:hypothetical protein
MFAFGELFLLAIQSKSVSTETPSIAILDWTILTPGSAIIVSQPLGNYSVPFNAREMPWSLHLLTQFMLNDRITCSLHSVSASHSAYCIPCPTLLLVVVVFFLFLVVLFFLLRCCHSICSCCLNKQHPIRIIRWRRSIGAEPFNWRGGALNWRGSR